MNSGTLRRALTFLALPLLGIGLVAISYTLPQRGNTITTEPPPEVRPSATWAPLPARLATDNSSQAALPDLDVLHRAILTGDLAAAQHMWDALQDPNIKQTAEMQLAGARIALLQGNLTEAQVLVWEALGLEPENADAWSLLGIILRSAGSADLADQALSIASELQPALSDQLFADRWALAVAQENSPALVDLAEEFARLHPNSAVASYYRGQALLAESEPLAAIELIIDAIQRHPDSPALVWYGLGEAYLARSGYAEAALTFEVAAALLARGDTSLYQASTDPLSDLSSRLAEAYVHSKRCAEAEDIARRLLPDRPDLEALVQQAVICQTPTPTPTPWIPDQQ